MGIKWTDQEKELLKKLCEAGKTIKDARKVFPYRSEDSISQKASQMELSLAGPTQEINIAAFEKIMRGKL